MAIVSKKLYPESKVELTPFIARYYDQIIDLMSAGYYRRFIARVIDDTGIQLSDSILDLGCGTGRNAALMLRHLGPSGRIMGVDLSPIMQKKFEKKFKREERGTFYQQRIDVPFDLGEKFELVFISFVLHGFPHEVRKIILENINRHLKPEGHLVILDYAEFDLNKMPLIHRWIFETFECSYVFDFIRRDWKKVLDDSGFRTESEKVYLKNYLRLLRAKLK
jgi:demethylmenaquinone methyltransferase/2-methoxy-6-polyprenyl-1,4-benzoquinol methylase